jgi:hypothetical protein
VSGPIPELQRRLTTIQFDRNGRILHTGTFGRTSCCTGANTPFVLSCSPEGRLLQLTSQNAFESNGVAQGQNPRDELYTSIGGPVVRRRLSFPDQDPEGLRPWPRPFPWRYAHNGYWISNSDWLLVEQGQRMWRGSYLHLTEQLLPDWSGFENLAPGPDRSWAVTAFQKPVDEMPGFLECPDIVCCNAECELQWTIPGEAVLAAREDAPHPGQYSMCLDASQRPVIGWSADSPLFMPDPPLSLAGLSTGGTIRWQSRCDLPWPEASDFGAASLGLFRETTGSLVAGPNGHVAGLSGRGVEVIYEDPDEPLNGQYNSSSISVWDDAGNVVWSRPIRDWSPQVSGTLPSIPNRWLFWDDDRIYAGPVLFELLGQGVFLTDSITCLDAATGNTLWSRDLRTRGSYAGSDTNHVFPFCMALVPGGGLVAGFRPFYPTDGIRRP